MGKCGSGWNDQNITCLFMTCSFQSVTDKLSALIYSKILYIPCAKPMRLSYMQRNGLPRRHLYATKLLSSFLTLSFFSIPIQTFFS